jgi:ABC-type multidrug transport system fused ATPase/permease subunit
MDSSKISKFSNVAVVRKSLEVLEPKDRKKLSGIVVIQVLLGGLDLIGVALVGALGALAVSGVQSVQPGNRTNFLLTNLHLADLQFQQQFAILGLLAATSLIGRTFLSILFTRRTLYFLSLRGAKISSELVGKLLQQPLLTIQSRTNQENLFAVTSGVGAITMGILGAGVMVVADFSLLIIITAGLFILNPAVAFGTLLMFSSISFLLHKALHNRAQNLGNDDARISIATNQKVIESLNTYRQMFVSDRRAFYVNEISQLRGDAANVKAEITFMPYIGKYVIEIAVVIGALLLGAIQFWTQSASQAVATLTVFMAAGSRLAPAILRLQQGSMGIKGATGQANLTFAMMEELATKPTEATTLSKFNASHSGFRANVKLEKISFTYPGSISPTINGVSLDLQEGKVLAVVGPSGAGKTTLIDILLGLIEPDSGSVQISGKSPRNSIKEWPGAMSYVPQDILISEGTIFENVVLGYNKSEVPKSKVETAIEIAQLSHVISKMPQGLETKVGDRGIFLSGGQRQRLGIARALLSSPKLIVLDEATSSLDGQTEADLTDAINSLKNSATVVLVAHRLSTVRSADIVIYLAEGQIKAQGSFEQIRKQVPDFARQAQLMGL